MLLDFETLFTELHQYHGFSIWGWANGRGVGWVLGVGGKPKVGYTIHKYRDRAIVPSMKHRNSHSVHVRSRRSLAAV